jgi:hypothetical protein
MYLDGGLFQASRMVKGAWNNNKTKAQIFVMVYNFSYVQYKLFIPSYMFWN